MQRRLCTFSLLALAAFVTSACADDPVVTPSRVDGTWGAEHIVLVADEAGASIEFDCAHATIDEPLVADSEGRIDVLGSYTLEGGPVQFDDPVESYPARFHGQLSGSTLSLTVVLIETGEEWGSYRVRRGNPGVIRKCL